MRVTNQMLMSRSTANLASAISRVLDLQTRMSSGKRISRPSDDPIGIAQALSYRTAIATLEQYQANAAWGETQMATIEQSLGSINTLVVRARELAIALSNDDFDATARRAAATEVQSIFQQILQTANIRKEGRYLFSGHETRTAALQASASGVVYRGDQGVIYSQIESATQMAVNLIGSDVFLSPLKTLGEGFDLDRGIDANVLLADLNQGSGVDLNPGTDLTITDENTGTAVAVDLSAATTVGEVIAAINTQLAAGGITNMTAALSPAGNSLEITAAHEGTVTTQTKLANLNDGAGIELSPGLFRVTTDDGSVDVEIDFSGAVTISDVIAAFDSQMDAAAISAGIPGLANVTLDINPGQTGLRVTDGNGTPLGLQIQDISERRTASDLGIVGYVNAQLIGGDLNPQREFSIVEGGAGQTTAADLGIVGTFTRSVDGTDLDPILTLTTPLSQLDRGQGLNLGSIRIAQGALAVTVSFASVTTVGGVIDRINATGLSISAGFNASGRGIQIVPTVGTESLMITNADVTDAAQALGIAGSPDLMGGLMLLIDALERDDREMVASLLDILEKSSDHVLGKRGGVGASIRRLQSTTDRLADMQLLVTGLLSKVEDADILQVTTALATQQNVYQAALNAVARSLTPSLADFIR